MGNSNQLPGKLCKWAVFSNGFVLSTILLTMLTVMPEDDDGATILWPSTMVQRLGRTGSLHLRYLHYEKTRHTTKVARYKTITTKQLDKNDSGDGRETGKLFAHACT